MRPCAPAAFNARQQGATEARRRGGGGSAEAGAWEVRRQGSTEVDTWGGELVGDQDARQRGHGDGHGGRGVGSGADGGVRGEAEILLLSQPEHKKYKHLRSNSRRNQQSLVKKRHQPQAHPKVL
ncbi:hypothetical protein GUJ93_ZPchr0002g26346 [Zizania palustris]|uniref:Uncharacterized protein n=1 Tax=Zizania palustris TaxID=103762 RepID=A0A8J5S2V7_ZIZPA|nr:hypothetical protein GUJ93_ZPchr0002g26346 [Zizania palustris]